MKPALASCSRITSPSFNQTHDSSRLFWSGACPNGWKANEPSAVHSLSQLPLAIDEMQSDTAISEFCANHLST